MTIVAPNMRAKATPDAEIQEGMSILLAGSLKPQHTAADRASRLPTTIAWRADPAAEGFAAEPGAMFETDDDVLVFISFKRPKDREWFTEHELNGDFPRI